ncbi:hypothetical protein BGZ76_006317 [Entomortierella beljakovae]|nr:hypothetical protein BGZ76_006317 [Entomortierella beljakovae]
MNSAANAESTPLMDYRHHQAQTDNIVGVMLVCFLLIGSVLGVSIMWIVKAGKAEHEARLKKLEDEKKIKSE